MKQRKPMKRGKSLARGKPLKKSGMRRGRSQRSARSGGHLFPRRRDPQYAAWIRAQPCLLAGRSDWFCCVGRIEAAHVKSRGAGGDDHANILSLCWGHHIQQHTIGSRSFEKRWGVDLKAEALALWARYRQETGEA